MRDVKHSGLSVRRKLMYSAVATLLGLGIVEGLCRVVVSTVPNPRWSHHANLVETVGFPGLNEILQPDPELFWRLRPNVRERELKGIISDSRELIFNVSIDEHGRRQLPRVPNATKQILFLGDSCTFGVGVDDDETFAALAQSDIEGIQSINGGVPGYSSYQGGLALEKALETFTPDAVVITFLFNDDSSWDQLSDMQHAQAQNRVGAKVIRTSRFAFLVSSLRSRKSDHGKSFARPRMADAEYSEQLQAIVTRCREVGIKPILMVWPLRSQMGTDKINVKQEVVCFLGEKLGVNVINLVPVFRSQGGTNLFCDVVHANEQGHRLVADNLLGAIRDE